MNRAKIIFALQCLLFFLTTIGNFSTAQTSQGSSKSTSSDGATYEVKFYGDLIIGKDRTLENAMMRGRGQKLVEKGILVTSDSIVEKTNSSLTVIVKEQKLTFQITSSTILCDGKSPLIFSNFKVGDMVTITTKRNSFNAISLRKGPMLFKGVGGISKLKVYDCSH